MTSPIRGSEGEPMAELSCAGFEVMESMRWVAARCRWVRLDPAAIEVAVERWGNSLAGSFSWEHPCHFFDGGERSVQWIFVLDVLNHCFWPAPHETRWAVSYRGEQYSGYWALAAALKKAQERGVPITDADYLKAVDEPELENILAGSGTIPLLTQRAKNLREAGRILQHRWQGRIVNLLEAAGWDALRAVRLIVGSFPSFRDEAIYQGRQVCFWKRAQLFVADVHLAFSARSFGSFKRIECLSAFADYKLPQVLRELGVLRYAPPLARRVDRLQPLAPGDPREVEIRGMTLLAVEQLKAAFAGRGVAVTSQRIDNWLWQLGQEKPFRQRPYHRCRTIFY